MNNTDIKKAMKSNEDFLALLKQAAQSDEYRKLKKRAEEGPHPTDEMLYEYVLDVLDDEDARKIRDHISLCGICAKEVLQIRMMEENAEEELLAWTKNPSLWERMKWVTSNLSQSYSDWWAMLSIRPRQFMTYAASGLSVATACLIIYFNFPWDTISPEPNIIAEPSQIPKPVAEEIKIAQGLITESYQTALTLRLAGSSPRLPWQCTVKSYGFSHSDQHSPASRAFGAGLWTGDQNLSKEEASAPMPEFFSPKWRAGDDVKADEWPETQWSPYFSLGRWGFLIQTVCESDEAFPHEFWGKQDRILSQIQEKFENMPDDIRENAKVIDKVLGRIDSVLKKSDKNPPTKRHRRKIAFQIGNLIKYLSPKHIPQG